MTSETVISAVIARIMHLQKLIADEQPRNTPSWSHDAEKLKSDLIHATSLEQRSQLQCDEFEKKIVELCYEIDDSLAELEMSLIPAKSGRIFSTGPKTPNQLRQIFSNIISKPDLKSLIVKLSEIKSNGQATKQDLPRSPRYPALPWRKRASRSNSDANENNISPTIKEENNSPSPGPEADLAKTEENITAALWHKEKWPVVCIWGESGTGKTSLVQNVFRKQKDEEKFETFAWVWIKRDFHTKEVLQEILPQLRPEYKAEDIMAMDEFKLTQEIFKVHDEKSCLVVIKDIRTVEDWQSIRLAFPTIEQSKSKILITTSCEEVAEAVKSQGIAYKMNPLTETECFDMLRDKAGFSDEEWEKFGKTIFLLSGGARLPAIVLGKSLKTMEVEARNQLLTHIDKEGRETRYFVIGLSYEALSPEQKPCFLYMGQFPEGQEIEIDKLYHLLSAENLIIQPNGCASASGSASGVRKATLEEMLNKLDRRSMVQVQDVSSRRKFKSCRIHDQIRDFCIFQGLKEDFFEIVEFKSTAATFIGTTPRLAVYLNKYGDEHTTPFRIGDHKAKKLRSLLIFDTHQSDQKSTWPSAINDLKEFIRLRVLDFNRIDFRIRKLPKGIDKLVLLKYLSFRGCCLEDFPSYISKLLSLETLDLRTSCKITIPDVLHTMTGLKHLYFPSEYKSRDGKRKLQLNGLENLEILVNLDTSVCKVKDLSMFKNLLTLTTLTHGQYEDLKDVIECLKENKAHLQYSSVAIKNFDCYTKERRTIFNNLLQCESLHHLNVEGQIDKLSKDVSISPCLTEMTFDGSELSPLKPQDDHPIEVLGQHEKLRSLVLSNDAFIGQNISFSAGQKFPNLKILKLQNLSKVEEVIFENDAMPQLSTLVIQNCRALKKVNVPEALKSRLNKGDNIFSVQPTLPNNPEN